MLCCSSCIELPVVLSGQGLTHVPNNLSENLVQLDLSFNNITEIMKDDFRTLEQVKIIDLSSNQIQILHERSFEHAYCLEELNLSYNSIIHLPHSIFRSNQNLKTLYLKKNRLLAFGDLSKAQHILESKSLIYLDVSFCNITYISCESLKGLPNLKTLKTDGNPLTQQNFEIKNPPKNLKTMKTKSCNSSIFEKFCCNFQEQGVEITPSTRNLSNHQTEANGNYELDFVLKVGITTSVAVFIIVVTSYFLCTICKNRRANRAAITRHNLVSAIQNRPLPQPPIQDGGYEEPIIPNNQFISSVTSNNLQLNMNRGYVRLPSTESDSLINKDTSTYHVSMESNHGSARSLSSSDEYKDNVPYSTSVYIYSYSDANEEEEENNMPVPPMKGNYSLSASPHFSEAKHLSTTGIPPRPCQRLRCPQDDGYFDKEKAQTRHPPTSPASPTRNVTTFSVKKIDSVNVYVSSISIELGQGS